MKLSANTPAKYTSCQNTAQLHTDLLIRNSANLYRTAFKDVKERVAFHSYESIYKQYELMCIAKASEGFI